MKFSCLIPVVVFLVGCSQSEPRESRSGSSESSGSQATAREQSEPGFDDLTGAAQAYFISECMEEGYGRMTDEEEQRILVERGASGYQQALLQKVRPCMIRKFEAARR